MTGAQGYLFRLPQIFYALAAIFFAWSIGNTFWEMSFTHTYSPSDDPMLAMMKSKSLHMAALEAFYMVANGAIIHVLLKIFERIKSND
jgi:urease accessory protein UreE